MVYIYLKLGKEVDDSLHFQVHTIEKHEILINEVVMILQYYLLYHTKT